MSRQRVLVTGATGFLGGALARALVADCDVRGVGRDPARGARLTRAGVVFGACDLAASAPPAALLEGVDAIVHCAARSSDWGSRAAFAAANIHATRHVLDAAALHAIPHLVLISSSSVYFRFRDQIGVREDMPLPKPVNHYAWSKAEAERLAIAASGVRTTVLRPRGIYGRGDTALLPRLLAACERGPLPLARGGKAVIDLTHVDDVVAAIRAVLRAPPPRRIYNVSGGEAVPVRRIVEASAARAGCRVRWRRVPWPVLHAAARAAEAAQALRRAPEGPRATAYAAGLLAFSQTLDISAIAADTGWRPAVSFDEGLRRTFDEAPA